ncbi:MAG: hypothetical protein K2M47_03990 [Clostridiales bacterium]|nr:hypothetical protein [Clostridiales bacterium]
MDKRRGIKNVTVSIFFRVIMLVGSLLVRRYLIRYIGNDVNGLNSLYLSILNVLSVAELGIDSAIIFCMYKPVVDGDTKKVSALYRLFTKLYLICGLIIVVGGCAVMPALPYLAKEYENTQINLYLTFGLMLISVVLSYTFSSKTSLINAHKNNYISTSIHYGGMLLQYGLQILVLVTTRSFVWYLVCRIVSVAVQWAITEIITRKKYGAIIKDKQKVDAETKKSATKNIVAMFMHKIGYVLVNTVDSIVISSFIGISILGKYSNYTTIMTAMTGVITLCFTPLTSVIGHMFVEESERAAQRYFNFFHTFNFILGVVFFLGYYAVIDNLVAGLFGRDLKLVKSISFVITVNYFIQFIRRSTILFRDASGTFYHNRWMPICEGLLNIALSILFVKVFPGEYNVVGVIVATIITNLFICHIVEPYVLYKYALRTTPRNYYIRNYVYIAVFTGWLVIMHFCLVDISNIWLQMIANGFIAIAMAIPLCIAAAWLNKDFRHYAAIVWRRIKAKLGKKHAVAAAAASGDESESASAEIPEQEHDAIAQETVDATGVTADSTVSPPNDDAGDGDTPD